MGHDMKKLIASLVELSGPSGYEQIVRAYIKTQVETIADEISIDPLGNLICRKGEKKSNGQKVMLAAHMDEIGVIVTHIDEQGFARFTNIGGVFPEYILGSRVRFLDGTLGVIGSERLDDRTKVPKITQMYLDVGSDSPANSPIKIGDVAAFYRPMTILNDRLVSKSMDDRIGVAILIETMRALDNSPHEVVFVFSVQEEVGLRGATTAAFGVNPDIGIAVDVTRTGDTPKGHKMEVVLGKGPAIKVRDGGMLSDPRIVEKLVAAAKRKRIPHQIEILLSGTTDARAIQLTRSGVPSGCISVPCRYLHSQSEMVSYSDAQNAVKLLLEFLAKPIRL